MKGTGYVEEDMRIEKLQMSTLKRWVSAEIREVDNQGNIESGIFGVIF